MSLLSQQTINEITAQMQENHTRNLKLKEENLELASKLKNLVEQYERREEVGILCFSFIILFWNQKKRTVCFAWFLLKTDQEIFSLKL